jgi:hypothetical protein
MRINRKSERRRARDDAKVRKDEKVMICKTRKDALRIRQKTR